MSAGLPGRLLAGYGAVAASFRAELAGASEPRLVFRAILGGALVLLARLPALAGAVPADVPPAAFLAAQLVAHLFFLPLALYGLAALSRLGARLFGGRGNWRAARAALFWALLLAIPPMLLAEAAVTLAGLRGTLAGAALTTAPWFAYLWFWAVCLAEAEGFRRPGLVFAGLMAIPLAGAALLRLAALAG